MFAVVRTGGKQYRVAAGDKIVVERLPGEAGDTVELGEVLLAGEGSELRATDGLVVAAEIIAQAKGEKVTVFKKRRRHNYRRKRGHRQLHTILRIVSIGGKGKSGAKAAKAEKPVEDAKAAPEAQAAAAAPKPAARKSAPKKDESEAPAAKKARAQAPLKTEGAESEMTDTPAAAKGPKKPAAKKSAGKSTKAK